MPGANYLGDRLIRTARPHKILDPANGPLIAVRLNILTRKTLGGLSTNLDGETPVRQDADPRSLCRRRIRRLRRQWRLSRLQCVGRHLPRRLHLWNGMPEGRRRDDRRADR